MDEAFLVTGGTGFIGSHLAKKLLEQEKEVVIFDFRPNIEANPFLKDIADKIKVIRGDVSNLAELLRVVRKHKIDFIVHLAILHGAESDPMPLNAIKVNCEGTCNVFEVAMATDVKRVVWASSVAAYGPTHKHPRLPVNEDARMWPNNVYAYCKLMNEFMGRHYYDTFGLDNIGLRYAGVYGPGIEFKGKRTAHYFLFDLFQNGSLGKPCIVGEEDTLINWLHVKDCVKATIQACYAKNPIHRIFNIAGFEHTVREVASLIKELVPEAEIKVVSEVLPGFRSFKEHGGLMSLDITRARQELGWEPTVDIKEGIRELVNYYRAVAGLPAV